MQYVYTLQLVVSKQVSFEASTFLSPRSSLPCLSLRTQTGRRSPRSYFSENEEIGNHQPDISQIPMPVFSTAGAVFGPQACSLEFRHTPRD